MEPPLLLDSCTLRSRALPILILLLAGTAGAQAPRAEGEAYSKVREARELARRLGTPATVRSFEEVAQAFLDAHPQSRQAGLVRLWLGDLLKDEAPRKALAFYRASDWPDADRRARDLAFLFEPPPPLELESWIGEAAPVPAPDEVTFLFFFSISHPQSRGVDREVRRIAKRLGPRGLRPVGIASVVDDHRNQTPERIAAWVEREGVPYPVAVDRQRRNTASASLRLYRGNRLPWGVFVDRYGRLAWIGPVSTEGNALEQCEAKLRALLADPTYDQLRARAGTGDTHAIAKLASIKTVRSATALFAARAALKDDEATKHVDDALRAMLPEGVGPADADVWKRDHDRYRYSFEADRLVLR